MTDDDEKMSRRREEATQQRGRGRYLSSQTSVVGVCVCVGAGWAREGGLLISVNLSMFVSVIYLMRVILSPTLIRPRWFLFSKLLCLIPELKQANLAAVDSIDYTYPTESVSFLTWCRIDRWIIKWSLILFISMVFFCYLPWQRGKIPRVGPSFINEFNLMPNTRVGSWLEPNLICQFLYFLQFKWKIKPL